MGKSVQIKACKETTCLTARLNTRQWHEENTQYYHAHVGEGDVVLQVTGKVILDEPLCLRQCLVSTTAEQGNARETQQCGDQGAVWYPSQTAHTAIIATC